MNKRIVAGMTVYDSCMYDVKEAAASQLIKKSVKE